MIELPKGVHRVISRGREYFYWQPGRGTAHAGQRTRLPDDPTRPEFWAALHQLRHADGLVLEESFDAIADRYEASPHFRTLATGTQEFYARSLRIARKAWGNLPIAQLRPNHVRALLDGMAARPSAANNTLSTLRALSAWALERGFIDASFTESVRRYQTEGGHKPWTEAQIAAAHEHLKGPVRRGVMLMLYTGQRGSDMVRMSWTDIDDGGFRLRQQKTGVEIWCPVVDALAAEMTAWERRPGPFVLRPDGHPYSRKIFSLHFKAQRADIPELAGTTLHGLRATAVINLRMKGLSTAQIQDIIGMSMAMIERYSRYADRKRSGQAAIVSLNKART